MKPFIQSTLGAVLLFATVSLLGSDAKLDWKQDGDALVIQPVAKWPSDYAVTFKITFAK